MAICPPACPRTFVGGIGRTGALDLYGDLVFVTAQDAHVVALEAKSGEVVWDAAVEDYRPRVLHDDGADGG